MKNSQIAKFKAKNPPKPPRELGKYGRALWKQLTGQYMFEDDAGGCQSLLTLCRTEDDLHRFRDQVEKDGDLILDRFGQKVAHPLLASIRGSETVKKQALAALRLDYEPTKI